MLSINNVKLKWLGHASFKLEHNGLKIYIDPYQVKETDKADIILITHGHYDHCSVEDIAKLTKEDTIIITTPDTTSKLASKVDGGKPQLIKPGDKLKLKGIMVEAVPAYNINKQFHPKDNEWVGYVITINNVRFYHSGDSDAIPEMNNIKADIAMLPVGGTYTMNAQEAASVANKIKPKLAIPMHYGKIVGSNSDAERFKQLCKCEVKIM
ncbi:MBL fold metallo-hydrolase [Candidatus Woesearchaeota archaeon]|nr:MBL fold metallo-hydrolase [Candidatus Woesearchaeota archaeon]